MIKNLTFVVIARNERHAIDKCLESITALDLEDCEVICVDSQSSDGTLSVMKEYAARYAFIRVFLLEGDCNAAIARNIGIERATKDHIFLVDGDIEVNEKFIVEALAMIEEGLADAITGDLEEIIYDADRTTVLSRHSSRFGIKERTQVISCGGSFISWACLVRQTGRYDERLDRNQDVDFSLRFTRTNRLVAIPTVMGMHHTIAGDARVWGFVRRGYPICLGIVLGKNLDRPGFLRYWLSRHRGFALAAVFYTGSAALGVLVLFGVARPGIALAWFGAFLLGEILYNVRGKRNLLAQMLGHYAYFPLIVYGLVFGRWIPQRFRSRVVPLL